MPLSEAQKQARSANLAKARQTKLDKLKNKKTKQIEKEEIQSQIPDIQDYSYEYSYEDDDDDDVDEPPAPPAPPTPVAPPVDKTVDKLKRKSNTKALHNEMAEMKKMMIKMSKSNATVKRTRKPASKSGTKTIVQIVNPQQPHQQQQQTIQKQDDKPVNNDLVYFKF
jgi:hypothetical protein